MFSYQFAEKTTVIKNDSNCTVHRFVKVVNVPIFKQAYGSIIFSHLKMY